MKKHFNLLPPMMPNFIRVEVGTKKEKQPLISVSDLSKEEAFKYADLMNEEFIKHWEAKQGKPDSTGAL